MDLVEMGSDAGNAVWITYGKNEVGDIFTTKAEVVHTAVGI
jgi:hypothetical protein